MNQFIANQSKQESLRLQTVGNAYKAAWRAVGLSKRLTQVEIDDNTLSINNLGTRGLLGASIQSGVASGIFTILGGVRGNDADADVEIDVCNLLFISGLGVEKAAGSSVEATWHTPCFKPNR